MERRLFIPNLFDLLREERGEQKVPAISAEQIGGLPERNSKLMRAIGIMEHLLIEEQGLDVASLEEVTIPTAMSQEHALNDVEGAHEHDLFGDFRPDLEVPRQAVAQAFNKRS